MAYHAALVRYGKIADERGLAAVDVSTCTEDAAARATMARRGSELLVGLGAAPAVHELRNADVCLRPVRPEDCLLIWEWANEPSVRAASFATEAIPWERHQQWFAAKLTDPSCAFFIALNGAGIPIGQVRCDVKGSAAVISISVDPRFRAAGSGTKLLRKGCAELFGCGAVDTIRAFIRRENEASHRVCAKAGFKKVEDIIVRGHPASHLVLPK